MGQDRRDGAAVLALEPGDRLQPLVDPLQLGRVGVERVEVAAQLGRQVVGLDPQRPQPLGEPIELGVDPGDPVERRLPDRHARPGRAVLGAQRLAGEEGRLAQRLDVPQPLAGRGQVVALALDRGDLVDLAQLEPQQVELPLADARRLAQLLEPPARVALGRVRGSVRLASVEVAAAQRLAEAVEQPQLGRWREQPPGLVLAVEGEQRGPDLAQVGRRGGATGQERPRASFGRDAPGEHQLLGVGGQPVGDLRRERGEAVGVEREDPLDPGLARTGAHDPALGLGAEQQVERAGEHRFARAGLPGHDVQSGDEVQFGPLDQEQVLDAQLEQHEHRFASREDG